MKIVKLDKLGRPYEVPCTVTLRYEGIIRDVVVPRFDPFVYFDMTGFPTDLGETLLQSPNITMS